MAIYELDGHRPQVPASEDDYFIADTAAVIGKVTLLKGASVWFGTVIRGDDEMIVIGEGSNVQDNSTLHTDFGYPMTIGKDVVVGHNVILHGCTIGDRCLIGIGAIVLTGARLGEECVVGAGAIVTEGKEFPPRSLILGAPGKAVRTLDDEAIKRFLTGAPHYVKNGQYFKKTLRKIG